MSHCWPLAHDWVAEQPGTQALLWQTFPAGQSVSFKQATHTWAVVSQVGAVKGQSAFPTQATQVLLCVSHAGSWGFLQSAEVRQPTQVPEARSHTWPMGHCEFCAEQPGAQVCSGVQMRPGPH